MAKHYQNFYDKFTGINENFKQAFVFENFSFDNGLRVLDLSFFGDSVQARTLKYSDCFDNNNFKSLGDFRNIGIQLTISKWLILRGCLSKAKTNLQKFHSKNTTCMLIGDMVTRYKKGSKYIRKIIESGTLSKVEVQSLPVVKTYLELTISSIDLCISLDKWMALWNKPSLNNEFRQFLLFERNNCLKINTRLSHFVLDVNRRCTFCILRGENNTAEETFYHLFFDCWTTKSALNFIIRTLTPELVGVEHFNKIFWFGVGPDNSNYYKFLLIFETFRFLIWKNNNKKDYQTIPNYLKKCRS